MSLKTYFSQHRGEWKGPLMAITAAVFYGFIPAFTLPIHGSDSGNAEAMSNPSILFYRFFGAAVILGFYMLLKRRSFRITRGEAVTLIYLAFLSDGAALFLLAGYSYMPTGIATTIHFTYPVVTAVIMMMFYNEARRPATIVATCMAVAGVAGLSWPSENGAVELRGVVIELISALCFALYLIRVNRSRVRSMDSLRLTFYVLLFGGLIFGGDAFRQDSLEMVSTPLQMINLLLLAFVCTVVTNLCLVTAVKRIGSTTAAVLGALEPLTAVVLGSLLFSEVITLNIVIGIILIIPSVIIVILTRGR